MTFTTVHNRYQVGYGNEMLCTEQTQVDAIATARRIVHSQRERAWIYDLMAHQGNPQEWCVERNGDVRLVARRPRISIRSLEDVRRDRVYPNRRRG